MGGPMTSLPDRSTSLALGNGYDLCWCVSPDGQARPWLVRRLCATCEQQAVHGCPLPCCAPHEQTYPPPRRFTARLAVGAATTRCSRPTRTGRPCRRPAAPGQACWQHREGGP